MLSASLTVWGQLQVVRLRAKLAQEHAAKEKSETSAEVVASFQDPLAHSTYDLQSRLFNILRQGFLEAYLVGGDEREKSYAIDNTTFLISQYFGWSEIIRREIQFLDQSEAEKTRQLYELLNKVKRLWATDRYSPGFRVFAGEQRAIGERMIQANLRGVDCLGYADFLEAVEDNRIPLASDIDSDVEQLAENSLFAKRRLTEVQHALVDLVYFCDPEHVRFPKDLEKA